MKFKLEQVNPGLIVCHIMEPLSKAEGNAIVSGVEKILANGKSQIVLNFNLKSAIGEGGADYFEKSLRQFKGLAKKMGGDIKYVVPDPIGGKIAGAINNLDLAIRSFSGQVEEVVYRDPQQLAADLAKASGELKKLTTENAMLHEKVRQLLEIVRQPSTDIELKDAVAYYRKLASDAEATPPTD